MGRRRVIALLVAGVVAAFLYLLIAANRGGSGAAEDDAASGPPAGRGLTAAGGPVAPPRPGLRTNELGQPIDEQGRPIGPPAGQKRDSFVARIEPGELPMNPPRFADAADRARYRAYWVDELHRRLGIWQRENPGKSYPGDAETRALLEELYDAGELAGDDEGKAALERQARWAELFQEFLARYQTTPGGAASFGQDPQYGPIPEPPVRPAGYGAPDPESTTKYDDPMHDPVRREAVDKRRPR